MADPAVTERTNGLVSKMRGAADSACRACARRSPPSSAASPVSLPREGCWSGPLPFSPLFPKREFHARHAQNSVEPQQLSR